MKVLCFGDIYGRIGRNALKKEFPKLIKKYNPDFVIANVDNLTSGRGPIEKHLLEMENIGIDIMTSGDHIFDNFLKLKDYLYKDDSKLLSSANFYDDLLSSKGYRIFKKNGKKLLVFSLQGQVFMNHNVKNPFRVSEEIIKKFESEKLDGIIIDFHKEATSEINGLAYFLDSKVSFIFGTHTHIQTNDEIILKSGTGFITDVGMSGSLNSIIGADFNSVKNRFLNGINKGKIEQSLDRNYVVSACFIEIGKDLKCEKIEKIRNTGYLD